MNNQNTEKIKLLPCPFCGSRDVQVWASTDVELDILPEGVADYDPNQEYPDDNTVMFEIGCMGCDFCTGKFLRPSHVIDKWNRRDREKLLVEALEQLVYRCNNHDAHLDIAVEAELASRQCPVCDACDSIWAIIHPEDAQHKGEK